MPAVEPNPPLPNSQRDKQPARKGSINRLRLFYTNEGRSNFLYDSIQEGHNTWHYVLAVLIYYKSLGNIFYK